MSKKPSSDAIEMRIKIPVWFCHACNCRVTDPENHRYHGFIRLAGDELAAAEAHYDAKEREIDEYGYGGKQAGEVVGLDGFVPKEKP